MRRPIRWYWAATMTFLTAYLTAAVWVLLTNGPFYPAWVSLHGKVGPVAFQFVSVLWVLTPPFVVGLGTYEWLRRPGRRRDEHLRCLKCGYILKGLTEPRCPECGERI